MKNNIAAKEIKVSSTRLYTGTILTLDRDEVLLPDGQKAWREVARHPGGSGIVALNDQKQIYLVRQYRYAIDEFLYELPAGKRENGEDPLITAQRELEEETGLRARNWSCLGCSLPSPGCYTEHLYLYFATDLYPTHQHLDPEEFLSVTAIPFEQAYDLVLSGQITDAKTQIGILKAAALLAAKKL